MHMQMLMLVAGMHMQVLMLHDARRRRVRRRRLGGGIGPHKKARTVQDLPERRMKKNRRMRVDWGGSSAVVIGFALDVTKDRRLGVDRRVFARRMADR